jgi:PAS domain S-box-containing protein
MGERDQRADARTAEPSRPEAAACRPAEEWLHLAQAAAGVGTFDWDLTTDAVRFSVGPGAAVVAGPLSGEDCFRSLHPDDRSRLRAEVDRAVRERTALWSEFRVFQPDGSLRWNVFRGQTLYDDAGRPTRLIGVFLDTTDRKDREESLRRSEQRLRLMLEQMPAILWTTDAELVITFCSGAGLAAVNLTPGLGVGRPIADYVGSADPTFYPLAAHHRALAGESVNFEMEWRGRVLRVHLEPLRDGGGRTAGCIGVALDVTAHRRAEAERRELEARLLQAQKRESLATLAGGLAHDFNNLLTGILGNASLALLDLPPESAARAAVQQVEAAALRAAALTRQLLACSGHGMFAVHRVDLSRLVEDTAGLLRSAVARGTRLHFELAAGLPPVRADVDQLRQVVVNLVTNASEALGDCPGSVAVRTGVTEADRAYLVSDHVSADVPAGRYAYVEVSDAGGGMDEATLLRIFDPFFSTKFTGRGLGLAAVLGIVRGHKGALKVRSEPNRGSTFKVLLPCAPAV